MFTVKLRVTFAYIYFIYIKKKERFIKMQLIPISINCYLKLNSQFPTNIIYAVDNKLFQVNDLFFIK